jgi:hypothetical protein
MIILLGRGCRLGCWRRRGLAGRGLAEARAFVRITTLDYITLHASLKQEWELQSGAMAI